MDDQVPESIARRRAYQKKWRDANPDKVAAKQARYWARKLERMKEQEESTNGGDERGLDG